MNEMRGAAANCVKTECSNSFTTYATHIVIALLWLPFIIIFIQVAWGITRVVVVITTGYEMPEWPMPQLED